MTLYPTHKCFDDALDLLGILLRDGTIKMDSPYWLVHALCKMPTGETIAHGWVEREGDIVITAFVIDGESKYVELAREDFYKIYLPVDVTRYTLKEAARLNIQHGNYGPWETRYQQACGETWQVFGAVEFDLTERNREGDHPKR